MFIINMYQHVEKHYMEKYNNILSLVKKQNVQHFSKWVWHFFPQLVSFTHLLVVAWYTTALALCFWTIIDAMTLCYLQ